MNSSRKTGSSLKESMQRRVRGCAAMGGRSPGHRAGSCLPGELCVLLKGAGEPRWGGGRLKSESHQGKFRHVYKHMLHKRESEC